MNKTYWQVQRFQQQQQMLQAWTSSPEKPHRSLPQGQYEKILGSLGVACISAIFFVVIVVGVVYMSTKQK